MNSLEKKMFFLPNKLFIKNDKLYIAFNLAVIPRDMEVTLMNLHIPIFNNSTTSKVYVKELTTKWSEKTIKKGKIPCRSNLLQLINSLPGQDELIINVTNFRTKWRLKRKNNHGIYIRVKNKNLNYLEKNVPYLVIDTI